MGMGLQLHHRKLVKYLFNVSADSCLSFCDLYDNSTFCRLPCSYFCPSYCQHLLESLIPSQSPTVIIFHPHKPRKFLIITASVLSTSLFLLLCYVLLVKFYLGWWRRRSSRPVVVDEAHGGHDFLDGDHGPVVDHHIWYINTVGLQPSIISEITVCRYKKGDGLIEGTDCSVCLSEFQEDETLRLLPKCSHAFHISCIDTWLRSHTNCPLCRAPIVKSTAAGSSSSESSNENSGNNGNTQVSIPVDNRETETQFEDRVVERRNIDLTQEEGELQVENTRKRSENSDEIQPIRRSVSLDCVSASKMIQALANFVPEKTVRNSDIQLAEERDSSMKIVANRVGRAESLNKFVGSSSIGRSLQNAPVSMKRSFSCSGKFLFSRST